VLNNGTEEEVKEAQHASPQRANGKMFSSAFAASYSRAVRQPPLNERRAKRRTVRRSTIDSKPSEKPPNDPVHTPVRRLANVQFYMNARRAVNAGNIMRVGQEGRRDTMLRREDVVRHARRYKQRQ